jgi:cholesterol transport system auxiliary component
MKAGMNRLSTTHFIARRETDAGANLLLSCSSALKHPCLATLKRLPCFARRLLLAVCGLLLVACTTPQPPTSKAVYDFGPVLSAAASATAVTAATTATTASGSAAAVMRTAAIALPEIEANASLDSPSLLYRLQYSNAQQLLPYAQARWSAAPAQLVRARVRDALALQGPVLSTEGGMAAWVLRMELDEFSQLFDSPSSSIGLVRLRASLLKNDQLAAQTTVFAKAPAPSQDAAGGVKALTAATDEAVRQLSAWLAAQVK